MCCVFFFQAEAGIRDVLVTGVQTCALPIYRRTGRHCLGFLGAAPSRAQDTQAMTSGPPIQLAKPDAPAGAPAVLTLADALQRAKQNDLTYQSAVADAEPAREDRLQARAGLLPTITNTTQLL